MAQQPNIADQIPTGAKIMACIGYVCVQWALLEMALANVIFAFLDLDGDTTGPIVVGGLDMLPRVNMAINLAEDKNAPKAIKKELKEIRKVIQDRLIDRRNQAVHGVHQDSDIPDTVNLTMLRWPEPKRSKNVTIRELQALGDEIQTEAMRTFRIYSDLGPWKFGPESRSQE